eukprot:scaffold9565_cov106-Isochrysis_galbana.AAC.2
MQRGSRLASFRLEQSTIVPQVLQSTEQASFRLEQSTIVPQVLQSTVEHTAHPALWRFGVFFCCGIDSGRVHIMRQPYTRVTASVQPGFLPRRGSAAAAWGGPGWGGGWGCSFTPLGCGLADHGQGRGREYRYYCPTWAVGEPTAEGGVRGDGGWGRPVAGSRTLSHGLWLRDFKLQAHAPPPPESQHGHGDEIGARAGRGRVPACPACLRANTSSVRLIY